MISSLYFDTFDQVLLKDLSIATILGFATDPVVEWIFNRTHIERGRSDDDNHIDFTSTALYGAADSVAKAAKVFGGILIFDLILHTLGIDTSPILPPDVNLRLVAPEIAVTIWACLTFCSVKRIIFQRSISGNRLGRVVLYDRLLDFVAVIIATAIILYDELHIDIGMGFQSVFAAGGIGALLFSFASKGLAEQIASGFVLRAWDAFQVGDCVKLGDGTEGEVTEIGLVETEITGYDNIVTRLVSRLVRTALGSLPHHHHHHHFCHLRSPCRTTESPTLKLRHNVSAT